MEDKDLVDFTPDGDVLGSALLKLVNKLDKSIDMKQETGYPCPHCGGMVSWKQLKELRKTKE